MSLPSPEEYVQLHKQAFRIAFDFLNAHFPPENGAEWWKSASDEMSMIGNQFGGNPLVAELMIGIFEYLDEERRKRYEGTGTDG